MKNKVSETLKNLAYLILFLLMWGLFLFGTLKLSKLNYTPTRNLQKVEQKQEQTFDYIDALVKITENYKSICEKSFQDQERLSKCYIDVFNQAKLLENDPVLLMEYLDMDATQYKVIYTKESETRLIELYQKLYLE